MPKVTLQFRSRTSRSPASLGLLTRHAVCEFSFHINTGFNSFTSKARQTWQPNPELTYGQV